MAYEHRIPSRTELHAVAMVWLRAIALAWTAHWKKDKGRVTPAYVVPSADGTGYTSICNQSCTGCGFLAGLLSNPAKALEEWFGYKLPFAINFGVELPENLVHKATRYHDEYLNDSANAWKNVSWQPDNVKNGVIVKPGRWGRLMPSTHIRIGLPKKPDPKGNNKRNTEGNYDEAIAIAAFVSSGPVYLFTCC